MIYVKKLKKQMEIIESVIKMFKKVAQKMLQILTILVKRVNNNKVLFESKTVYDNKTIQLLFITEHKVYNTVQRFIRVGIAIAAILAALFLQIPTALRVLSLALGAWLLTMPDFPGLVKAEGIIAARKGAVTSARCEFKNELICPEGVKPFGYKEIGHFLEDENYFYVFKDKQTAVMVQKEYLSPKRPDEFRKTIETKSGSKCVKRSQQRFGISREDLFEVIKKLTGSVSACGKDCGSRKSKGSKRKLR